MNEEEKVRRALDARLSGLAPSPARRARIRAAAMRPQKERKPVLPRLAAAMACLALAVGGVLGLTRGRIIDFTPEDRRSQNGSLAVLADGQKTIGDVNARSRLQNARVWVQSEQWDGNDLILCLMVENGCRAEVWTPTETQLAELLQEGAALYVNQYGEEYGVEPETAESAAYDEKIMQENGSAAVTPSPWPGAYDDETSAQANGAQDWTVPPLSESFYANRVVDWPYPETAEQEQLQEAYFQAWKEGRSFGMRWDVAEVEDTVCTADGKSFDSWRESLDMSGEDTRVEDRRVQNVLNQPYGLNVLTLRVSVRAVTYSFYFDGTSEYALRQEAEEPLQVVTALVPLSSLAEVQLTGTGAYNGSLCRAEAQVGTQRVTLTLTADGPAFPCESRQEADETIRTEQPWRALMVDESGTVYRMQRAGDGEDMQDDALHLTLTGSGRLPARATIYVYRCAEGDAAPDEAQICAGEGIPLTVTDGMEN